MNKRRWLLVAGTIVLAGCDPFFLRITRPQVCVPAGFSENDNRNDDQVDLVECTDATPGPVLNAAPHAQP